ncbi:DUF2163 domain-containing protein [Novosphingobium sp. JCM 18896]|uniref:DUF2163 domain-containing protein n=1 Tax=Novosphingobium sp. JCM 18896 TaxID=2989731 RepID=UPI0022225207|nr:DUF2163 domain-containing protein [Novosphingobium sp. JCM 18896]MCW1429148.1 DUF2163 domain-containing protein [Novosphingobium sp. JCM 18896]
MTRTWFAQQLDTAATFWRVLRRDGVALGFTSHDRDLWFDGVLHRAAPGMTPSAVRRSAGLDADSAEVEGALSHDAISGADLAAGRFDGAELRMGLVDWDGGERTFLYRGTLGGVVEEDGRFTAELTSRKALLSADDLPRTSPSCRAVFCGRGCNLSAVAFTHEAVLAGWNADANAVTLATEAAPGDLVGGLLRWLDGPLAGLATTVMQAGAAGLVLDMPLPAGMAAGQRAIAREGCDHTLDTCATRFANAVNFQGEPFLPGNDLLTRYPVPAT